MTSPALLQGPVAWGELLQSPHGRVLLGLGACTLIAPLLCLVLRWGRRGNIAWILGSFAASALTVGAGLSLARRELLVDYARLVVELAAPFEVVFVGWLLFTTVRTIRGFSKSGETPDFYARIDEAAREASGLDWLGGIVAGEISTLYYGLFAWRARPAAPRESEAFSYTESGGYGAALPSFVAFVVFETCGVHILLSSYFPRLVWVLTVGGVYAIVWLFADHRAVRLRPILLTTDTLLVRAGCRGMASVPLAQIESVRTGTAVPGTHDRRTYRQMNLLGLPDFVVQLKAPAVAHGLLGSAKTVTSVGFCVDDAPAFRSSLAARGITATGEPDHAQRDFFDRLRDGLRSAIRKSSVADAMAREMALIACVFSFGRLYRSRVSGAQRRGASAGREFTIFQESGLGSVVGALVFVALIELSLGELVVREKSALLANLLLFGGVYAAIWFFANLQAVKLRPFVVDDEALWLRVGVSKEAKIPLSDIEEIAPLGSAEEPSRRRNSEYVRCTAFGPPQLMLRLRTPARIEQSGGPRMALRVGVTTDDDANFVNELRSRMARHA